MAALDTLPSIDQVMPARAVSDRIFNLSDADQTRAAHLAYASTSVRDLTHQHLYTTCSVTKMDTGLQLAKDRIEEFAGDLDATDGYIEALRHKQKKKNLQNSAFGRWIERFGTPEQKAGQIQAEIEAECAELDRKWMEKKKGTKWCDVDDDAL